MLITPRIYENNRAEKTSALLTVTSQQPSFPATRVLDSRRSKVWRSRLGWNVVTGLNDLIDFTEGTSGAAVAILRRGNYATGTLMAAEIEFAVNAVAIDNSYTVTYSVITRLFTITRSGGADTIAFPWVTGPNTLVSFGLDAGYTADDTGATTYVSDVAVQMSAESLTFDLLVPTALDAAIALETNLTGAGTLTVLGDAVGDFAAPGFTGVLASGDPKDTSKFLDFFASTETFRFWRFFFEDRDNQSGFMQCGAVFLGPKVEFDRCYALNLPEARQELSEVAMSDQGAIYTDLKPNRREWAFNFRETTDPDKDKWEAIADAKHVGDHLFYALDPLNKPLTHTIYGYIRPPGIGFEHIRSDVEIAVAPVGHWNVSFPFSEAIG